MKIYDYKLVYAVVGAYVGSLVASYSSYPMFIFFFSFNLLCFSLSLCFIVKYCWPSYVLCFPECLVKNLVVSIVEKYFMPKLSFLKGKKIWSNSSRHRKKRHFADKTARLKNISLAVSMLSISFLSVFCVCYIQKNNILHSALSNAIAGGQKTFFVVGEVASEPTVSFLPKRTDEYRRANSKNVCSQYGTATIVSQYFSYQNISFKAVRNLKIKNICVEHINIGELITLKISIQDATGKQSSQTIRYTSKTDAKDNRQLWNMPTQLTATALSQPQTCKISGNVYFLHQLLMNKIIRATDTLPYAKMILPAILLGERKYITPKVAHDFRLSGITHIVCLSGLHLNIIICFLGIMLACCRVSTKILLQIGAVSCFVLIIGPLPSLIRAAIMGILALNGQLINKPIQSMNSLFIAVIVMLIWVPENACNISFILSIVATAAIILALPFAEKCNNDCVQYFRKLYYDEQCDNLHLNDVNSYENTDRRLRYFNLQTTASYQQIFNALLKIIEKIICYMLNLLVISLVAQIGVLPIIISFGNGINLATVPANLLVVPLLVPLIGLAIVALLTSGFSLALASVFFNVCEIFCQWIIKVANCCANFFIIPWLSGVMGAFLLSLLFLATGYIGYMYSRKRSIQTVR